MSGASVIEAAKSGDTSLLDKLVSQGANINEQDEHGWSALNWAAGRGDAETVKSLLRLGADVTLTGRDKRTALAIAKAANRPDTVEVLKTAEQQRGVWQDPALSCQYCKAYTLKELRRYEKWQEQQEGSERPPLSDDDVVFVHQDFTVTKNIWQGEDVIYKDLTPAWQAFCRERLGFAIPDDTL